MKEKKCLRCDSGSLIDEVVVADTMDGDLTARISTKPRALLLKGHVSVPLKALVCGSCGMMEFYTDEPAKLAEAGRTRARNS